MPELATALSQRLVDTADARSLSSVMRRRRWSLFLREFPQIEDMHVLDIGGEAQFWKQRSVRPAHVTMVNLFEQQVDEHWLSAVVGDGCDLPRTLPDVDLVFSNSVIEHVGGHWRRSRFADNVRRAADRYWVQTPYRYFPIEPHVAFPFFQHVPTLMQARILVRWPVGNYGELQDRRRAIDETLSTELLDTTEMRHYFPDGQILAERLGGLKKSLIALRR